jgi:hypothetical protein
MAKEKGRQWDGKSRVSNETYRQNWNDIFKKEKTLHEVAIEGYEEEKKSYEDEGEI